MNLLKNSLLSEIEGKQDKAHGGIRIHKLLFYEVCTRPLCHNRYVNLAS